MATAAKTSRTYCFICKKEKSTYTCDGCSKRFCKQHLKDHENELELNQIETEKKNFPTKPFRTNQITKSTGFNSTS